MSEDPALVELIAAITDAFPPHPLDPTEPRRAWAGGYLDAVAFRSGLEGRRWDELDARFMEFHGETIHFLKPPAFGELLPAFLVTVLRQEEQLDMLPSFLFSALTPPAELPSRQPRYETNLASLTPDQQRVVGQALDYLAQKGKSEDVRAAALVACQGFRASIGSAGVLESPTRTEEEAP